MSAWVRHRFEANPDDYRPVNFPPPGPYWCTSYGGDESSSGEDNRSYAVIVAYLPPEVPVTEFWPEATSVDSEPRDAIVYTDRFPRPDWYVDALDASSSRKE